MGKINSKLFRKKACKQHAMHYSWDICPVCIRPVRGWLVAMGNALNGEDFRLRDGSNVIGRSFVDCDVFINEPSLGKKHAKIVYENGEFILSDFGSAGGCFVNGIQVSQQQIIDNDIIKLADLEFKFKCI